ncbi:hypothetical protein IWQ60_004623 [Tieghemiomyces parasiticus]|uniref:J domain-containing protein n=1 Tax=Tieghemiomyces parasiticus TaxID=78921 RepID=A0A9W8ADX7_9FUNG|nr:hypothetical protein IWQ60_004623 [Tieghemiomyces parasiticus]
MRPSRTLLLGLLAVSFLTLEPALAHDQDFYDMPAVQPLLDTAHKHFTAGSYQAALDSYQEALAADPTRPLTHFKRATVYLTMGRTVAALTDLSDALKLDPDFEPALAQRSKLLTRQGLFAQARADLEHLRSLGTSTAETVRQGLEDVEAAERGHAEAVAALAAGRPEDCVKAATAALKHATQMAELFELRSNAYLAQGEGERAVADLNRAVQVDPSNLPAVRRLALLYYYALYQPKKATAAIKICLNSDPENKACKAIFRELKKHEKEIKAVQANFDKKKFNSAAKALTAFHLARTAATTDDGKKPTGLVGELEDRTNQVFVDVGVPVSEKKTTHAFQIMPRKLYLHLTTLACRSFAGFKKHELAVEWCTAALTQTPDDSELLTLRADSYLELENADAALADLNRVKDLSGGQPTRELQQKLMRAMQLQRVAQRPDYYKVLGVPKEAGTPEIKRAYRKLVKDWHPDKYEGELSTEEVKQKMFEINKAWEILSDDEKRTQYDQGHDPDDPNGGGAPGGGFPFGHGGGGGQQFFFHQGGGSPFGQGGGGGQQFKFMFN